MLDNNGICYIFLCSVLTGEYTVGTKGIKTAPVKNIETQEWYDSVCDNTNSPTKFIIFNDNQAYPTYLVLFRQYSPSDWRQLSWWEPKQGKIRFVLLLNIINIFVYACYCEQLNIYTIFCMFVRED